MSGVGKKGTTKQINWGSNKRKSIRKKTRLRRPNLRERQHGKPERPHCRCYQPRQQRRRPPLRRPALGGRRAGVPARPLLPSPHFCSSESRFFRAWAACVTGNDSRGARRQRAPGPTRWSAAVGPPGRACGNAHAQLGLNCGGGACFHFITSESRQHKRVCVTNLRDANGGTRWCFKISALGATVTLYRRRQNIGIWGGGGQNNSIIQDSRIQS